MFLKSTTVNGKTEKTREGKLWKDMLSRVKAKNKTSLCYFDVKVSENFLDFQKFAGWCNGQFNLNFKDENGKVFQLDKDLLGDGKLYSEHSCCFVPRNLNTFLRGKRVREKPTPSGVFVRNRNDKITYEVSSYDSEGVYTYVGTYKDLQKAADVARDFKCSVAKEFAVKYEGVVRSDVILALLNYERKYADNWQGYEYAIEEYQALQGEDE